ncbi:MAG TPA: hypothetical protein VKN76_12085 [Kiloniellaceae bacterium]|nr:hypothetical protein [Kiloniellaceae bacterium]
MGYRDNIAQVLRGFDDLIKGKGEQSLTIDNNMEYASYLQNKQGYYVISGPVSLRFVQEGLRETQRVLPLTQRNVSLTLEKAGFDLVAYYRSLASELRPPVRAGEGYRKAHPGHWADITGNLASSYRFRVNKAGLSGAQDLPDHDVGGRIE